jgi:hypothetical protein
MADRSYFMTVNDNRPRMCAGNAIEDDDKKKRYFARARDKAFGLHQHVRPDF